MQGRNHQRRIGAAIAPITRSFGINAVRRVGPEAVGAVFAGQGQELPGGLGILVRDGQRAESQAAEADLIPVVVIGLPPIVRVGGIQSRLEAFLQDGLPDGRARLRRQRRVEPVISQRQRGGHFGGVQKMGGIPVGKPRGGEHVLLRAVEEDLFAGDVVGETAQFDAAQGFARNRQEPFALFLVSQRRRLQQRPRIRHRFGEDGGKPGVAGDLAAPGLPISGDNNQSGMTRPQSAQDIRIAGIHRPGRTARQAAGEE